MKEELRLRLLEIQKNISKLNIQEGILAQRYNVLCQLQEDVKKQIDELKYNIECKNPKELERQKRRYLNKCYKTAKTKAAIADLKSGRALFYFGPDFEQFLYKTSINLYVRYYDLVEQKEELEEQMSQIRSEVCVRNNKIKELYEEFNTYRNYGIYKCLYQERCHHPICYNIGYYRGNNPMQPYPKEEANYSVDICLECGSQRGFHRPNNRDRNEDWCKPKYVTVKSTEMSIEEIRALYQDYALKFPENKAIQKIIQAVK